MDQSDRSNRDLDALRERLSRLSEASLRINESLDFDTVLQGVLDSARSLRGAHYGVMTLMNEGQGAEDILSSTTERAGGSKPRHENSRVYPARPPQSARSSLRQVRHQPEEQQRRVQRHRYEAANASYKANPSRRVGTSPQPRAGRRASRREARPPSGIDASCVNATRASAMGSSYAPPRKLLPSKSPPHSESSST